MAHSRAGSGEAKRRVIKFWVVDNMEVDPEVGVEVRVEWRDSHLGGSALGRIRYVSRSTSSLFFSILDKTVPLNRL
jgi:hypothetical protein